MSRSHFPRPDKCSTKNRIRNQSLTHWEICVMWCISTKNSEITEVTVKLSDPIIQITTPSPRRP